MNPVSFDYTQVKLQEQIPLNHREIADVKQRVKDAKKLFLIMVLVTAILLTGLFFYARPTGASYNKDMLVLSALLVVFGTVCLVGGLIVVLDLVRAKKDIAMGKNVLKSVLIYKGKTKYGTYFIFVGPDGKKNIQLMVHHPFYQWYHAGQQLTVHYLKSFREIIHIET